MQYIYLLSLINCKASYLNEWQRLLGTMHHFILLVIVIGKQCANLPRPTIQIKLLLQIDGNSEIIEQMPIS